MKTKICPKCRKEKPLIDFYKDKTRKDGLCCWCKKCGGENNKKYYHNNKERLNKYRKKWSRNNKEKEKEYSKKWYENNKEYCKNNSMAWAVKNPYRYWGMRTLRNHRRKKYIINITLDEITELAKITTNCSFCNNKLDYSQGRKERSKIPTIDRKNNEKELNINNIWIICFKCNTTKLDRTMEEFVKYCKIIIDRFGVR